MPCLLIHHAEQTHGVVLDGRLLIGRAAPGGIVIPDSAVSRIHAWIDRAASGFYIADAESRTGTRIGDEKLTSRHTLVEGDVIHVGPATIHYHDTDTLPDDVRQLPTAYTHDVAIAAAGGILFACTCGAPLWAPTHWVGRRGKCGKCGQRTPVPAPPSASPEAVLARPAPIPQPHAETQSCSICQWKIESNEQRTRCPTCGLTFHSECWQENKGCSAYGCASVGALATPEDEAIADRQNALVENGANAATDIAGTPDEPFPMEFAILGGSIVAMLVGLIAFGVPSLLLGIYSIWFTLQKRRKSETVRTGLIATAISLCVIGCLAGLWFSTIKWMHRPMAAPWQHA